MAQLRQIRQSLLPDEMQDVPYGAENVTPWISPDDHIQVIGTPDGPRYVRNNQAMILPPTGAVPENWDVNPEKMSFDEIQTMGRMMPPGPPPPAPVYATNISETADRWAKEGKLTGANFSFVTNTPEETRQAREKGIGKWGKIIGPPEAAATRVKPKAESPYPGAPPTDENLADLKKFNKFWDAHVQENWGGQDPLKFIPAEARKAAEQPLKDKNAQFIYDYETYGDKQMGPAATFKYKQLQKEIKQAGDLAEKKAEESRNNARREQVLALNFWKENTKKDVRESKLTDVQRQELIGVRQEKNNILSELRRMPEGVDFYKPQREKALLQMETLKARENELLRKDRGDGPEPSLNLETGSDGTPLPVSGVNGRQAPGRGVTLTREQALAELRRRGKIR